MPSLTRLALTHGAVLALRRSRPVVSAVAFSFTLSERARIDANLEKRITVHGRARWQVLADALTVIAPAGGDHEHLTAAGHLAEGLYRLTAAPAQGAASSITIRVG